MEIYELAELDDDYMQKKKNENKNVTKATNIFKRPIQSFSSHLDYGIYPQLILMDSTMEIIYKSKQINI